MRFFHMYITESIQRKQGEFATALGGRICNYGSLPKTSNALNIRTLKIIAKDNFKMVPKISNSGLFSEMGFLKFRTVSFFRQKKRFFIFYTRL